MNLVRTSAVALVLFFAAACTCMAQSASSAKQIATDKVSSYYSRPFHSVGIAVHMGSLGAGIDIATPLAHRINLRGTANFFMYDDSFGVDGINYNASLRFHSGEATVDFFPFGGFHISPGVLIADNEMTATLNVPANGTFSLGDQSYISGGTNPLNGAATFSYPRMVSPEVKIGFGNIIPRSGRHWNVPFEIGAAYMGHPMLPLTLAGTACQGPGQTNCSNLATDPTAQKNLAQEQSDLNEDLKRASVYPIVSLGFSYRF